MERIIFLNRDGKMEPPCQDPGQIPFWSITDYIQDQPASTDKSCCEETQRHRAVFSWGFTPGPTCAALLLCCSDACALAAAAGVLTLSSTSRSASWLALVHVLLLQSCLETPCPCLMLVAALDLIVSWLLSTPAPCWWGLSFAGRAAREQHCAPHSTLTYFWAFQRMI